MPELGPSGSVRGAPSNGRPYRDSVNIQHADFHGEWNYTIAPSTPHIKAVDS